LSTSRTRFGREPDISGQLIATIALAWVVVGGFALALLRAASGSDDAMERELARLLGDESARLERGRVPDPLAEPRPAAAAATRTPPRRRREQVLIAAQAAGLIAATAGAAALSEARDWQPPTLVAVLALLAVGSDVLTVEAPRFRVSGSFLALALAMALLGPAPAAAIGLLTAALDGLRSRPARSYLLNNLLTYATFPLAGALLIRGLADATNVTSDDGGYAIVVFLAFVVINALNFLLIAVHTVLLSRGSLVELVRRAYLPVLPWELATGLLTAFAVYAYGSYQAGAIGFLALGLVAFQLLLRGLVRGEQRGRELELRVEQLGVRHEGMLGLVLDLAALRDPPAARHAAAVAHHARALARAAGLSEREQDVVHAAGLLHDIGKVSFPDTVLEGERAVDEQGLRAIQRHPELGARLLRRVPGLWEVADAVEAHHERWDGTGYPYGLKEDRIPRSARIVAVAEVYDTIAGEGYRGAGDHARAVAEMERLAGRQLDAQLVRLFVAEVLPRSPASAPSLEEELQVARRARGLFDVRPA
jgi:putative nucleotidyltransferase with HDIG domain